MSIIYEAERMGPLFRGLVIDMDTFEVLERTSTYASAETAKSAAVSLWRAKQTRNVEAAA